MVDTLLFVFPPVSVEHYRENVICVDESDAILDNRVSGSCWYSDPTQI